MEFLYGEVAEAAVKSVMYTPDYFIMESQDVRPVGEQAIGCEVILKPLVVPEFVHVSEDLSVQEADPGLHRRFDLACGEIKYFKPGAVMTKPSTRTPDNTGQHWSKSVSPKRCNCFRSREEIFKKCSWPGEFDFGELQCTARSVYQAKGTADQLTVINVEGERSSTPANSVIDNVDDSAFRNIPTPDLASSQYGSFFETEEGSTMDDNSSYHSTPLDSTNLCTSADESRESPIVSFIKGCSLREAFPNNLDLKEKESSKPVLVGVNSKQKIQHMFNNMFDIPKSRDMSSSQLSTLVDDSERDLVGDAEERRKSLVSAAIAADLPKFQWGDLEMEDLESLQVLSKNDMNIDSKSVASSKEFPEDVELDVQEIVLLDVDQEVREFGFPDGGRERRAVFSLGQQTDFSGFVVPKSNSEVEVGVAVAVQTSPEEISTSDEAENLLVMPSGETKLGAVDATKEVSCKRRIGSDLALLTMGEVQFLFSSVVDNLHNVKAKNAEAARIPVICLNRRDVEQTIRCTEFSFRKQLKGHQNLGLGKHVKAVSQDVTSVEVLISQTPGLGGVVSFAEAPNVNKYALKERLGNVEVPIFNDMAVDPVTEEVACEEFRLDNNGEEKVGEGKERFRQRLWDYLFENMNRAIDELYFLCELESDVEHIEEALLVLDEAGADFKDLKARVDGFDRVSKDPELPQLASVMSTNTSISSEGDLQQRCPHAIAGEVRRMACSQEQADMLSSSLEVVKQVPGSPQSGSLQGRRQADSFGWKKGSSLSDTKLLSRSDDSANRKSAPNSSFIARFMNPTASSEQRASSREKQLNVPTGSKTALEAWKEKKNWGDIFSSPLSGSARTSRSSRLGRKSTEPVHMLHDKFMSLERKMRSPSETKKEAHGKQARATHICLELENEKVQRLQKTTEKLSRVSRRK